ncbi:MAG: methionine synthase [Bacteroidales bacterium]|nr:methionine synthase [Bacteroidales bacterium]
MRNILANKVLLLDGGIGTEIQKFGLTEEDFRSELTKDKPGELKGNNDLLVLSRPDVIREIHRKYIEAGADIITTCTFNANAISQHEYGCEDLVDEINFTGVRLARETVDEYNAKDPSRHRYVAGSVGPSTKLLSLSDDPDNPAKRSINFDQLRDAYVEQMRPLLRGGVDIIIIETSLDPINAKAALAAATIAMEAENRHTEVMLSATVTDSNGYLLSGQSLEAFVIAVSHYPLLSIGFNCSLGAAGLLSPLRRLSECAPFFTSVYPNAGLPNQLGQYDDVPETMGQVIKQFLDEGLVNIVGGCCGTTPAHIAHFRKIIDANQAPIRKPSQLVPGMRLSGLQPMVSTDVFVNVGERCNVAGSRKFLRLIKEKNYAEAIEIAQKQVEDGAMVIDINMDDGLIDAHEEMVTFLNILSTEPEIAKVPVMIDSSKFDVIEAGLKCLQGKGIVNSISLKEGEEPFLAHARTIKSLGAAVVVMAFDEEGQATTYQRRIDICARAYRLLTEKVGFNPYDIIFDPNILTVATGMEEHLDYAYDYVRAAYWIKANLPGVRVSGGLSNLSFAFRGNNALREAMHAVFLYRAVAEGMDMAIMNPATAVNYADVDAELRQAIEDVLFEKRDIDSTERLIAIGSKMLAQKDQGPKPEEAAHTDLPLEERLKQALIKGNPNHLDSDLAEALEKYPNPVDIIAGPLMDGMNQVGEMFGDGRMFLPQVVKTARTMKRAVEILRPHIEEALREGTSEAPAKAGKVILATVKGDVHDIGKNIVGVVLSCNNYEVIDLGVMVPPEKIIEAVKREKPDFVGLSGLITPSLDAMVDTVRRMREAGIHIPVMIGGAATSQMHTAVKIAPNYGEDAVIYVRDAAQNPIIAAALLSYKAHDFIAELHAQQEKLRHKFEQKAKPAAEAKRLEVDWSDYKPKPMPFAGIKEFKISVADLRQLIDWLYFFHAWRVKENTDEGRNLRQDAEALLDELCCNRQFGCVARVAFYPAHGTDTSIILDTDSISTNACDCLGCKAIGKLQITNYKLQIDTPRQPAKEDGKPSLSLCDWVHPVHDHVGVFAATITPALSAELEKVKAAGDDYKSILLQTILDRLAEAASEWLHRQWNWDTIRPAVGYPSLPDQKEIFKLDQLLDFSSLGIALTETGAMYPQASVAGIYISHPSAEYFVIPQKI